MKPNPNSSIVLIGAGEHGKVVAEILEALQATILGFYDDDPAKQKVWDYPVRHRIDAFGPLDNIGFVISLGNNAIRKKLDAAYKLNYATAVHPMAFVSKRSKVGEGTVAMAGVCVNTGTVIGRHCILNTSCAIDHDCLLEDFVHISPGVALAGKVQVGEGTHIGIGASVIPGIRIGKGCIIGAGAAVIRDVPDGTTVVGVPGRAIR